MVVYVGGRLEVEVVENTTIRHVVLHGNESDELIRIRRLELIENLVIGRGIRDIRAIISYGILVEE